jgi:hypothetical protein
MIKKIEIYLFIFKNINKQNHDMELSYLELFLIMLLTLIVVPSFHQILLVILNAYV